MSATSEFNLFRQPELVHSRENNSESEIHLQENQSRFNRQCKKVYDLLRSGEKLTVKDALINHGISSLPRRCLDLKEMGVPIQTEWMEVNTTDGRTKIKLYYL